ETFAPHTDAIADRLAAAEYVIKESVCGIDNDGAWDLVARKRDDLSLKACRQLQVFVLVAGRGLPLSRIRTRHLRGCNLRLRRLQQTNGLLRAGGCTRQQRDRCCTTNWLADTRHSLQCFQQIFVKND